MIDSMTMRRAAFGALAFALLATGASAWRLVAARSATDDLRLEEAGRLKRLSEARELASTGPAEPASPALDRSRAIAKLRATLGRVSVQKGCTVEEFQAATEEAPYLTTYALDSNDPGWMQVSLRALIDGRSTSVMAAVAALRTLDVPFEVDSMEFTRRSTDKTGMATVGAQITMRVLVYKGEG